MRSRPGRGSCFTIELSLAGTDAPAAVVGSAPDESDGLAGLELWVVEDDPEVREALRLRLCAWGARVRAFSGAAVAGDAIDRSAAAPDLLRIWARARASIAPFAPDELLVRVGALVPARAVRA